MLCRFCFSHRNFGCFDLVCLIVPSTFVIFPIEITVIYNIICLWMGNLYAATPGQSSGVARYYTYIYLYLYTFSFYDMIFIAPDKLCFVKGNFFRVCLVWSSDSRIFGGSGVGIAGSPYGHRTTAAWSRAFGLERGASSGWLMNSSWAIRLFIDYSWITDYWWIPIILVLLKFMCFLLSGNQG